MYSVYALTDPRDGAIRYIGMSKNVWRRYAVHLVMTDRMTPTKGAWVKELGHLNLAPLLEILEIVETKEAAFIREASWIQHYLNLNASLLNMVNTGIDFPTRTRARPVPSLPEALASQEFIKLEELAREIGVTPFTVKRWIKREELVAYKIGVAYRIKPEDYRQFQKRRRAKSEKTQES